MSGPEPGTGRGSLIRGISGVRNGRHGYFLFLSSQNLVLSFSDVGGWFRGRGGFRWSGSVEKDNGSTTAPRPLPAHGRGVT